MGTNCASLEAELLFFFSYDRDFIAYLSNNKQIVIEAYTSTSRYLNDQFNIDNL